MEATGEDEEDRTQKRKKGKITTKYTKDRTKVVQVTTKDFK